MAREPHTSSSTNGATSLAEMDGAVDLARDRELVEACQSGDQTAFAELYSRYHRRLLRFCLRRLHATDDAEEATQEAFTRAWRALPRFGGDRRFYPWLTVIAGNVCTDMLRRRSRVVPLDDIPLHAADAGAAESEVDERLLRQVDLALASKALGHLSDRHQRVLRLREATEWTSQRIAEHEGVAVPAVDTLLWRARQAFKREFSALSDAGGLAAAVGVGVAALRRTVGRTVGRAGIRVASLASMSTRSPGTLVATVAAAGVVVAGGGAAFVAATSYPAHATGSAASAAATASPVASAAADGARDAASAVGTWGHRATPPAGSNAGPPGRRTSTSAGNAAGTGLAGATALGAGTTSSSPLAIVAGPGSAVSGVTGVVGQVVGTGVAVVGETLGLGRPTVLGTGTASTGGSGTGGTGGTALTTVGSAAGAVSTAVSGVTGTVTTLGSAAQKLLGATAG